TGSCGFASLCDAVDAGVDAGVLGALLPQEAKVESARTAVNESAVIFFKFIVSLLLFLAAHSISVPFDILILTLFY
ncbi:MAG: hypothetical protein RR675_06095, partial [Oscillospiraceae bacterium]